jgi:arsenite transporter
VRLSAWAERHQVALYLAAIAAGAAVGLLVPGAAELEVGITPVLAALLFVTFLGVPFARVVGAFADRRFLAAVLALNFVVLPAVVFALSRFVAHDEALLIGVLLVLLTPCVDYVVVFTGLAGGARERLLAATPVLMVLQILLLPLYLLVMAGEQVTSAVDPGPFVEAFVVLVLVPLAAAALVQAAAVRVRAARGVAVAGEHAMVPLMMLTLAIVVASQVPAVSSALPVLVAVPIFAVFALAAAGLGLLAGRVAGLDAAGRRAVVFSGVTRNSLVVLPLALALPASLALAPLVVVTQTLVELLVMVVLVVVVPRVIPAR